MNAPTSEHQIIKAPDGTPLYALIPWDEYLEVFEGRSDSEVTIPHEVVGMHAVQGLSLIRAWREHLKLTQEEVARRMGVSRPAFAQMEARDVTPRLSTLKRIAEAMGIEWEQLRE